MSGPVDALVDALPDMLARLKLTAMRDRLDGLLDEAARGDLSLRETLALLCRAEVSHREERRIQMGTGIAKFPHQRTLEGFDFAAQPSLNPKQVRHQSGPRRQPASVRVPAGTVVLVTSLFRRKATSSHFVPHVEAPTPEHNHEAQTSERTLTSAWRRYRC